MNVYTIPRPRSGDRPFVLMTPIWSVACVTTDSDVVPQCDHCGMARLFIPDRFMVRSADEFSAQLDTIGAHYWFCASRGELTNETSLGLFTRGAYEAAQWLGGVIEIPPGSAIARVRTRYDLLDLLSIADLACFDDIGRWESVVRDHPGALEYFESHQAAGARTMWEWALGLRATPPLKPLEPEQVRQAQDFFARCARNTAGEQRAA